MIKHYSTNIQNIIQRELFKAQNSIKIAVSWFTNDLLFQPLLLKLSAGVNISIILNKDEINLAPDGDIDFNEFVQRGGMLYWNDTNTLLHDKFCVIDDSIVISGSYNWTNKAEYNEESITLFREDQDTVEFYNGKFRALIRKYGRLMSSVDSLYSLGPVSFKPYTKLFFYHKVAIRSSRYHTYAFARLSENGYYALLDSNSFKAKTDYVFSDIGLPVDDDKVNNIWLQEDNKWGLYDCNALMYSITPRYDEIKECRDMDSSGWGQFTYHGIPCYFVTNGGLKGIVNGRGESLLRCQYETMKWLCWKGIAVESHGKWGLLYKGVEERIIPCNYDEVKYLGNYTTYSLRLGEKYALLSDGLVVPGALYDEICVISDDGQVTVRVRENGKYGMYYGAKLVAPCKYDSIRIYESYGALFISSLNGRYGVLGYDGKIILDFVYDSIEEVNYPGEKYYVLIKDGKYGQYDLMTKVLTPCLFNSPKDLPGSYKTYPIPKEITTKSFLERYGVDELMRFKKFK